MTLLQRQDKERKALIEEIIEHADDWDSEYIVSLAKSLKQVTTSPEEYFKNLDKKE